MRAIPTAFEPANFEARVDSIRDFYLRVLTLIE